MTREALPLPEPCVQALSAIEQDPLHPGPAAERHMTTCTACSEARVFYLAQEEAPEALVPAGYYDRLPGRILGKLPVRSKFPRPRLHHLGWAAAAILVMAVGAGAFWAGRANRTPLVEASLPKPADTVEVTVPDAPFRDKDEDAAQLQNLSPAEMKALLQRMDDSAPAKR